MKTRATFIEPMLLLSTEKLPQGPNWLYEIKLDGDRSATTTAGISVMLPGREMASHPPTTASQAAEASGNPGMSVCQSARGHLRPLGSGVNGGEDEGVSVA